ncbi:uncharacterized protein LOC111685801 [Lucilia cuprina]|uniref:uncharacterized protein LOC111685801 n=1 Tax=Lucilia cuprina TaxID=7375 RepID=UPI001F05BA39|nr:uncharacterized protein LOC111685801 [Lucilia cuprina]
MNVLEGSFFLYESVAVATKINLPENVQAKKDLRELSRITAEDGVSLIAVEKSTGKPIAVAFNKIQFIPDNGEDVFFVKFRKENAKSPNAQSLMDFMASVDEQYDIFEKFNLDCTCELMFLATLPQWERKGIAKALARYTIELTKELKNGIGLEEIHPSLRKRIPKAVTAIFTSMFSQKVGKAEGFTVVNTVPYTQFSFEGKTYDQRIDPRHKGCEHVVYLV